MGTVRIAGIGFVFAVVVLHAQIASEVAFKVTDPTGASIPHAKIQARTSESRIVSETETDARGDAVLYLEPHTSTISVHAAGFDGWQYKIEAGKDVDKPLIAVLRIESYYGPTLVNAEPELETEPQPPIVAAIPLEPLEALIALPGHNLRHRARHRP